MLATAFILIFAAIFSLIVSKYIPKISPNYVSIFVGILCGLIPPVSQHVATFNAEVFMILLVAPLLFYEGQATAFSFVRHHLKVIVGITVIMVALSTLLAGFSLHYFLGLSLPLAFVMAAISTPTDATATASVSEGLELPKKTNSLLKLESLFNDASGLVLLQATAVWLVLDELSIRHIMTDFFISAIGGVLVGFIISMLLMYFRQHILRVFINTVSIQTLIYLVTPFMIYIIAEELHLSGIIAVVVSGLLHNSEERVALFADARQNFTAREFQRVFADLLNSLVFVVFGITSTKIMFEQFSWLNISIWGLSGLILYLVNLLVRYCYARFKLKENNLDAWLFAIGGVHGAVTLALVFTLPGLGVASEHFNLILMSELTLIILSMLVPTIVLRFILPKEPDRAETLAKLDQVRSEMVQAGIAEVHKMKLPTPIAKLVIAYLKDQSRESTLKEFTKRWKRITRLPKIHNSRFQHMQVRIFQRCFFAERAYIRQAIHEGKITFEEAYFIYEELLLAEALLIDPYNEEE